MRCAGSAALEAFVRLDLRYEAARTHLLPARALGAGARAAAVTEAWAAFAMFDSLNAAADVDETAAYLRYLGVRAARTGPRGAPELTRREREVLSLLERADEPADRQPLFLTRKTVEHHVHSLLTKLGVSNRPGGRVRGAAEPAGPGPVSGGGTGPVLRGADGVRIAFATHGDGRRWSGWPPG